MTLKVRLARMVPLMAVMVLAAALYVYTGINPADWSAVNSMTMQTSGKTLFVEFTEVSRPMRVSVPVSIRTSSAEIKEKFSQLRKDADLVDRPLVSLT